MELTHTLDGSLKESLGDHTTFRKSTGTIVDGSERKLVTGPGLQGVEVVVHSLYRLLEFNESILLGALHIDRIEFLVVKVEIILGKSKSFQHLVSVLITPVIKFIPGDYILLFIISNDFLIIVSEDHLLNIQVKEFLLVFQVSLDIVLEERLLHIRNHSPVEVGGGDTAKLLKRLQLEDDSDQLHGSVDGLGRSDIGLSCVESIGQEVIERNGQTVVHTGRK